MSDDVAPIEQFDLSSIIQNAPKKFDEATIDDIACAAEIRGRWKASAPLASCIIDDESAWRTISTAWSCWYLSQKAAGLQLLTVTVGDLYGADKGGGRRAKGIIDRIEEARDAAQSLEEDAARVHLAFTFAGDRDIRNLAKALYDTLRMHAELSVIASDLADRLDRAIEAPRGGPGSLTAKNSIRFDYVADVVLGEWRRLNLAFPATNAPDGGLIDLLNAMHRESVGRDVPGAKALLGRLRAGRTGRNPNIPLSGRVADTSR